MLRLLFGEPPRSDEGLFLEVRREVSAYLSMLRKQVQRQKLDSREAHRLDIWAKGFVAALDELEQSVYCSRRYAEQIHSRYVEEMKQEERNNYHRHLYFYKNGFIRIFSILDKLGVFLDNRLGLRTGQVKERFSYFTALRQMYEKKIHPELQKQLYEDKQNFRAPMGRLRRQRNMEIHAMNAELIDDMQQTEFAALSCIKLEDCSQHVADLDTGYEMAGQALRKVFAYFVRHQIV